MQRRRRLISDLRDRSGSITVEATIIIPILFIAFLVTYAIFDAYRNRSVTAKAAYTVSDLVSRETGRINQRYLSGLRDLFTYATNAPAGAAPRFRLTSIAFDTRLARYEVDWSLVLGGPASLTTADIQSTADSLPNLLAQEYLLVLEIWSDYRSSIPLAALDSEVYERVIFKPRFVPRLRASGT